MLSTDPGSRCLFDEYWKVGNLLHRALQAKLVVVENFRSLAMCGDTLKIANRSRVVIDSLRNRARQFTTLTAAISESFTSGDL